MPGLFLRIGSVFTTVVLSLSPAIWTRAVGTDQRRKGAGSGNTESSR